MFAGGTAFALRIRFTTLVLIELSKQMVDMLHEPYFDRIETEFRHEHPDALTELHLSYLSANLDAISFHDSIVVFDKKRQHLPKSELR